MTEKEAYIKLSGMCAMAEYCLADIRKKLDRWNVVPDDGNETAMKTRISKALTDEKFVDEERYARAFVRDKFRYNRWGYKRIEIELKKKGIHQFAIEDALEEINEAENLETLRQLLESKRRSVKGKNEYEINQKLLRFAYGRGFSIEDAMRVLNEMEST